jgi:hypothetical protein
MFKLKTNNKRENMKQITRLEQDYFNSKINWNKFESEKESIQKKYNASFKLWLDTFIEEKELPMDDIFEITKDGNLNIFSYKSIYAYILISTPTEKEKIKKTIVKIDFLNGDVLHYFRHLANAIAI